MKRSLLKSWRCCQRFALSWQGQWLMLMLLLGKILWGMWQWRDLTYGDTSSYYNQAVEYLGGRPIKLVFSPLYVAFYAWFSHWFEDAFVATMLHRVVILVLLSTSLLFLARALLPKAVAWLVAAWWVVLPINWNALYEVHLFGFIPLALGCWIVGGRSRRLSLSVGLALIWSGALLVRNEYALTVALLTVCCVAREFVLKKKSRIAHGLLALRITSLALPSLLVLALAVAAWRESWPTWKGLQSDFHGRHTLNMAQVYPFSYQQRHPEWTLSPWTQGHLLMKEHFGKSMITFSEAFRRNPKAIMDNVLWHLALTPAGLQMGLFSYHYGPFSPDFTPPQQRATRVAVLSALLSLLVVAGTFRLWRRRAFYRRFLRSRRGWCWLALLCTLPPCVVAIVTQRPRASYIFPLSFFVMAFSGLCLYALLKQFKLWRHFQALFPLAMIAVLLTASSEKTTAQLYAGQPLREAYHHLFQFRNYLQGTRVKFASRQFTSDLDMYLNYSNSGKRHVFTLDYESQKTSANFQATLEAKKVNRLYLDSGDLQMPSIAEWLRSEGAKNWRIIGTNDTLPLADRWMFLVRQRSATPALNPAE